MLTLTLSSKGKLKHQSGASFSECVHITLMFITWISWCCSPGGWWLFGTTIPEHGGRQLQTIFGVGHDISLDALNNQPVTT